MEDALLAWRNIWRNPRRSLLTILAVFFASSLLVFMLSFQLGTWEQMIDSSVRRSSGHIQIQAEGYLDSPRMWRVVREPGELVEKARRIEQLAHVTPRSEGFILAAGPARSRGMMVSGVDPDSENTISSLPKQILSGRYLQSGDRGNAVIGVIAAERLQVEIGDEVTLLGQGRDGSVGAGVANIVGIYRTGIEEFDRSTLQIPMGDFDEIFSMEGAVHKLVILAEQLSDTARVVQDLERMIPVNELAAIPWDVLTPGLRESIELDLVSGMIMYVILVIIVAFSILNTFFMAIFERKREFGVLLSIGTKPFRLVRLMLIESLSMTIIGLLLGVGVGVLITLIFQQVGISFGEDGKLLEEYGIADRLYPKLSLISLTVGPAIVFVVTTITALIPALKIVGMRPVEAMRSA